MAAMTISQALRKINKLKNEAKQQFLRAEGAVFYDEKNPPAFSFSTSVEQGNAAIAELVRLETALRITNAQTKIEWESKKITLSEATSWLKEWRGRIAWLNGLTCQAQAETKTERQVRDPYTTQIEKITTVHKCDFTQVKQAEQVKIFQDRFDALNDAVEAANHRTTLVEG